MKLPKIVFPSLFIMSSLLLSCSSAHQFIDVDEMLLLEPKLSRADVLEKLGNPTEVRAGIITNDSTFYEVFFYQVKDQQKKQVFDMNKLLPPLFFPRSKPSKNFSPNSWSGETTFALIFKDRILVKWGYVTDDWINIGPDEGDILVPGKSLVVAQGGRKPILKRIPIIGPIIGIIPIIGDL